VQFCNQFSFFKCVIYTNIFPQLMFISISMHPLLIVEFSCVRVRVRVSLIR